MMGSHGLCKQGFSYHIHKICTDSVLQGFSRTEFDALMIENSHDVKDE